MNRRWGSPTGPCPFVSSPSLAPFPIPARRPDNGGMFPLGYVSSSVADPGLSLCRRHLLSLHFPGWVRTVLLSVDVAKSFGSLMVSIRSRSPAGLMLVDFCRCWGFCFPSLAPSQRRPPGIEYPRGAGQPRETRHGHSPRSPVWNRIENPAQASEMGRAPATPRYEAEMRGKFRGGTASADGLPAVTWVTSGVMSNFRSLPARCIGRRLPSTPQRKSQALGVPVNISVRTFVGSPPRRTLMVRHRRMTTLLFAIRIARGSIRTIFGQSHVLNPV